MGFSRQEYWNGLPFPSPGDLPDPGIEPRSPALQADALTSELPGKPDWQHRALLIESTHSTGYWYQHVTWKVRISVHSAASSSLGVCCYGARLLCVCGGAGRGDRAGDTLGHFPVSHDAFLEVCLLRLKWPLGTVLQETF